jgi:hypothetical protein
MKNLLALVGAVVVLVGGLGWYLGWYKLGTTAGTDGHTKVTVDVDGNEVRKDLKKGEDAIKGILNRNGKDVPGTPTSRPLDPPSGGFAVPELPKLPTPPASSAPVELAPDGSLKIKIDLPPPPVFSGNK